MKIGIPRGLLGSGMTTLLETYFTALGLETVVSPESSRPLLLRGAALAPTESCLSFKIYLGEVDVLRTHCDKIVIVRNTGTMKYGTHCSRYKATYELMRNLFREDCALFLELTVDLAKEDGLRRALLRAGKGLGFSAINCRRACRKAMDKNAAVWRQREREQQEALNKEGYKVLLVAHSYLADDMLVGRTVADRLRSLGITPIFCTDLPQVPERAGELSKKIPWLHSNEQVGTVLANLQSVDGVILISAFPCGPDSMIKELLCSKIKVVPVIQLSVDEETSGEWLDVRLESFSDLLYGERWNAPCQRPR